MLGVRALRNDWGGFEVRIGASVRRAGSGLARNDLNISKKRRIVSHPHLEIADSTRSIRDMNMKVEEEALSPRLVFPNAKRRHFARVFLVRGQGYTFNT